MSEEREVEEDELYLKGRRAAVTTWVLRGSRVENGPRRLKSIGWDLVLRTRFLSLPTLLYA